MLSNYSRLLKGVGLLFVGVFVLLSAFHAEISAREIRVFPTPPKNLDCVDAEACDLMRLTRTLAYADSLVRVFSPQVEFLIEDSLIVSVELPINSIVEFTISDGIVTIVGEGTFIEVVQKDVQFGFVEDTLVVQLMLESTNVSILRGFITTLTNMAGNPIESVQVGDTIIVRKLNIINSFKTDHLNLRGNFEMNLFGSNQNEGTNLFDLSPNSVLNGQLIVKPVQAMSYQLGGAFPSRIIRDPQFKEE